MNLRAEGNTEGVSKKKEKGEMIYCLYKLLK